MRPESWSTPATRPCSIAMRRTWPVTKRAPAPAAAVASARSSGFGSRLASPRKRKPPWALAASSGSRAQRSGPSSHSAATPRATSRGRSARQAAASVALKTMRSVPLARKERSMPVAASSSATRPRPAAHRVLGQGEERSAVLRLDAGREDPSRRARRLGSGDAAFEDRHPRARLGESQGGGAAVDAGADHDDVAVHFALLSSLSPCPRRRYRFRPAPCASPARQYAEIRSTAQLGALQSRRLRGA